MSVFWAGETSTQANSSHEESYPEQPVVSGICVVGGGAVGECSGQLPITTTLHAGCACQSSSSATHLLYKRKCPMPFNVSKEITNYESLLYRAW